MPLHCLIYSSRPFGYDQAMLNGILVTARANNTRDGITGALICRADMFLQLLEGPKEKVMACYARICRDDRHLEVALRHQGQVVTRRFGAWAMRDDPAQSWMWDRAEVAQGALDHALPNAFDAVFTRLASRGV